MPFKSKAQERKCYETNGFGGKVDCDEWAKATDEDTLPDKLIPKKQNGGGEVKKSYNPNLAQNDKAFQQWYAKNTMEGKNNIPYSAKLDYDYYSYYKNGDYKNYQGGHFPDTYKRPNEPTFSDESIYSTPENIGGHWQGDTFIPQQQKGGKLQNGGNPFTFTTLAQLNQASADATIVNGITTTPQAIANQNLQANAVNSEALRNVTAKILAERQAKLDNYQNNPTFANSDIEDKMRFFPNDPNSVIDTYFNPLTEIGKMADNLGHAKNITQFGKAALEPVLTGAFLAKEPTTTKQFVNKVFNPITAIKSFKNPIDALGEKLVGKVPEALGANEYQKGGTPFKLKKINTSNAIDDINTGVPNFTATTLGEQLKRTNPTPDTLQPITKQQVTQNASIADILSNPMTALKYKVQGQQIPANFTKGDHNVLDNAVDVVNPMTYVNAAANTAKRLIHPINTVNSMVDDPKNVLSALGDVATIAPIAYPMRNTIANRAAGLYDDVNYAINKPRSIEQIKSKWLSRELSDNIATNGQFNQGVYNLKRFPNYVAKVEQPEELANKMGFSDYINYNFVDAMRNIPNDAPIAKVYNQINIPNTESRALIMNKLDGISPKTLPPSEFENIPQEAYQNLYRTLQTLKDNKLAFDYMGDNYYYHPEKKQFQLFDINPTFPTINGNSEIWNSEILNGIHPNNPNLNPDLVKKAIFEKVGEDYNKALFDGLFDQNEHEYPIDEFENKRKTGTLKIKNDIYNSTQHFNSFKKGGEAKLQNGGTPNFGMLTSRQLALLNQSLPSTTAVNKNVITPIPYKALPIYKDAESTNSLRGISSGAMTNDELLHLLRSVPPSDRRAIADSVRYKNIGLKQTLDTIKYLSNRQLLMENGNPSVVLDTEHKPTSATDRSYYIPLDNKMVLYNPNDMVSETSHAYQYNKTDPSILEANSKPYGNDTNSKKYITSYDVPGTIEYNAHKEVEPVLDKRLIEIRDSLEKRKENNLPYYKLGGKIKDMKNKKFQFAGQNPCGEGTQWDAQNMQCVPIPTNPNQPKMYQQQNGVDNSGIDPTPLAYTPNFHPLADGFHLDSDGTYRKKQTTQDKNILDYTDPFKALNFGLGLTQGIANQVNDIKTKNTEKYNLLKARYSKAQYNPYEQGLNQVNVYQNGGSPIQINPKHKGLFTKEAKAAGMSVQQYAAHVLANKNKYSPDVVKRANFAHNFAQNGGLINNTGYTPGTPTYNNPINIIPSNNITMQNTPFPVMAYPENGNPILMQPGTKHKFKGSKYVTEVPIKQNGGVGNRQYDCPSGNCDDNTGNRIHITLPDFLKSHPSKKAIEEALLGVRASFYKNNLDYGKYPVTSFDPQPSQNGVYYGPGNNILYNDDLSTIPTNVPNIAQNGGNMTPEVEGVGPGEGSAELEEGEVYQANNGNIQKIAEDAGTHEEGGADRPDVSRVLEDTADKRKDVDSKLLRITPNDAFALTGFKPKGTLTHSKLYEQATAFYDKKLKSFENKVKSNLDYVHQNGGEYAKNSLDQNLKLLQQFPTKAQIFDTIYNHQEQVKYNNNIDNAQQGPSPEQQQQMTQQQAPQQQQNGGRVKFDLGGSNDNSVDPYKGGKTSQGRITPTGQDNAFTYEGGLPAYQQAWQKAGLDLSGYAHNADAQAAVYDYLLKNSPDTIRNMWKTYGNTAAGIRAGLPKTFTDKYLNNLDNLKKLREGYVDDLFGARTLIPNFAPQDNTTTTTAPSINNRPDVNTQYNKPSAVKPSVFNEPLHFYDTASNIDNYLSSSERIPVSFEQLNRQPLRAHELNPQPAIDANQGDFNAALQQLPSNGIGYANIANLLANKYKVNNEITGQYQSQNNQIHDRIDELNNGNKYQLDQNNLNLRDRAVQQQLQGMEVERKSKLNAFDDYLTKLAQNHQFNLNGNLALQLSPYFNQQGQYNGNKYVLKTQGDGSVNVFDSQTGKFIQTMYKDKNGQLKSTKETIVQGGNSKK